MSNGPRSARSIIITRNRISIMIEAGTHAYCPLFGTNFVGVQWIDSNFDPISYRCKCIQTGSDLHKRCCDGLCRLELSRDCTSDWFMLNILMHAWSCISLHDLYHSVHIVTWRTVQRLSCCFRISAKPWHIRDNVRCPKQNDGIPCGSKIHEGKRGTRINKTI